MVKAEGRLSGKRGGKGEVKKMEGGKVWKKESEW